MSETDQESPSPSRGGAVTRLFALMVTAFTDTLGAFLVLALLPFYADEMGATPFVVTVLVAAFSVAQTLTAPLWGRASDRWGRRPVILVGLVLSAVAYLAFAFADTITVLLLSRLAQGAGGGTVAVVFAYIADATPAEHRAERIGWVTAATSAAAMVGPAVGSLAARYDPALPGLAVAALSVATLLLAWVLLPEPPRRRREGDAPALWKALGEVVATPARAVHRVIWIYAVGMLATSGVLAVAGLYLDRVFGITEATIWPFFTFLAGVSLLVRVALLGPVVRRWRERRTLRLGAFCLTLGIAAMPLAPGVFWLAIPLALMALGTSFLYPCTTALVSRLAPSEDQMGQVLGVQQAFGGLSRIGGPLLAGLCFELISPAAPFFVAGALAAVVVVIGAGTSVTAAGE